jgi:hypothetical protein
LTEIHDFRLRFTPSPLNTLNCKDNELPLPAATTSHSVVLKARERAQAIEGAPSLVLQGSGWATAAEAERFGRFYSDVLARTYARLRLGADYGARAAKSAFTNYGLAFVSEKTGRPTLNDIHGLMVFERTSRPHVVFASLKGDLIRGVTQELFLSVFSSGLNRPREIAERERVALELFNASLFQRSEDARFLLLMSGFEALIEQQPQSNNVLEIIQRFLSQADEASDLSVEEKTVLKSGLGQLQRESIRQAGRRLVRGKIGTRSYAGVPAEEYFERCYILRSRLVHGELPFPTREEVSALVAQLEVMLSDLLSTDLLDVGP